MFGKCSLVKGVKGIKGIKETGAFVIQCHFLPFSAIKNKSASNGALIF